MRLRTRPFQLSLAALVAVAVTAFAAAPAFAAGDHVKRVRYGPFTLPAATGSGGEMDGAMFQTFRANIEKPCTNCYITRAVPSLRYADGSDANFNTDAMLHHAVWSSTARSDVTCPGSNERFFATGNERSPLALPVGYGYRVNSADRWNLLFEAMNMSTQSQTVYLDLDVVYRTDPGIQPVTPLWWDIDLCGDSRYSIPAGLSNTHRTFSAPFNGKLVAIAGHQHDDGVYIELQNHTQGRVICKSTAGYGTKPAYQGHVESMSGCHGNPLATFKQGDSLRMVSVYDSEMPQNDVMGIMVGYGVPSG